MAEKHFHCKDCNYKFKRKEGSITQICPYCGSKNIAEYKPTMAEDLLSSVE